ncbi:S-adenosyl-L-methionine-dependent methyltransferase [Neoconidiobolus thromboides FSU 785]|nr:S-adenosyl-L-methionine-dependent methyltransferase [Neoconidiobolus thromboides FSU 785]
MFLKYFKPTIKSIISPNFRRAVSSQTPWQVFDRDAKKWHRDRSIINHNRETDYLKDEMGLRMVERLEVIKRKFPFIVDLGSGSGHIIKHIDKDSTDKLIMCDISEKLLYRDEALDSDYEVSIERQVMDEELLKFEKNSIPAVISNLSLHWVNDLPGTFIQIKEALMPDGVFLACMFGGDTLFELRTSLQLAEQERGGGLSPRVSPFAEAKDISNLLSRAGFSLTTVDVDEIVVNYPSIFHLMEDLDAMGESNAVIARQPFLKRDILLAANSIYQAAHGNEDGSIPATFQILYLIGWKPDCSQPKPKERGSAKKSLKEVL